MRMREKLSKEFDHVLDFLNLYVTARSKLRRKIQILTKEILFEVENLLEAT